MKMVMIVLNTNDNYWMSIVEDMNHSKIKYRLQSIFKTRIFFNNELIIMEAFISEHLLVMSTGEDTTVARSPKLKFGLFIMSIVVPTTHSEHQV